ncbi:unnamed protein product [Vicia faba]|uniref:BED-type domain-containing protein n=1 Tax=Vicia faba TaxID=3906 RepID=A0AAV1B6Y8_VICFA|nr:unnamed protein product [Vicia faba]
MDCTGRFRIICLGPSKSKTDRPRLQILYFIFLFSFTVSLSNLYVLLLLGFHRRRLRPSSITIAVYDSQAPPCHHAGHHEPPAIKYCQPLVYVKYPDAWSCLAVALMEHPVPYVEPTQAVETALPPLPPSRKKRLVNASGSRKTSTIWLDFNILSDEPEPIAACKHCHKRYRRDPKTHGTSNMLAHSKVCHKNPNLFTERSHLKKPCKW